MNNGKRIVAIYTRVSTREQAVEGYSLEAQKRVLLEYCAARQYDVYEIYTDEGVSAKDIKHRPGMLSLLEDAQNKKFNMIIIWKLTRFSRNLADLTTTCDMLDKLGISLASYSEAFDSNTPAGRMVRSMIGTVAQFEREVIAENVLLSMLERAKQGKRTCNEVLGYNIVGKDLLEINEREAEYVRFCFDRYLVRKSFSEVACEAREKRYHGKRGKIPSAWSVERILTRTIYAGYNLFKGNIYKGNHKLIVSVEQFNRVQRIIVRQGKNIGRTCKRKIYILPND